MWREKARQLFPALHEDLEEESYNIYSLFLDLLPMAQEAHDSEDPQLLRRIYTFAEWCYSQKDKDLWNAAGVAFYEHLFDDSKHWESAIAWLSKEVIEGCWTLWEFRLSPEEFAKLKSLIQAHHKIVVGNSQPPRSHGEFGNGEGI
jgi:hypothetical protein